ncbi:hypothetical protein BH23THE1_BH23THE1_31430 [soil metagenome]
MKSNKHSNRSSYLKIKLSGLVILLLLGTSITSCDDSVSNNSESPQLGVTEVPEGFIIEMVVDGLTYPTSVTWDDEGNMFVVEAGGGLNPEQLAPSRLLRVEQGQTAEISDLSENGVHASVVGLTWYNGAFFITHRAADLSGAVSKVTKAGQVTQLFDGILDSQAEHQINDIAVGPDGMMYITAGAAGNSGVMDLSVAPWVMVSPDVHTTACQDIVLLGKNFKTPDFRTEDPTDTVMTGAYVPFGTETTVGQVIPGVNKCGGSILKFNPDDPSTIATHAWGFRNLIGITWNDNGQMFAAENGYDVRGSRPVNDEFDVTLKIMEGVWYGVPDYSAAREPLTEDKFESPDSLQSEIFINGELIGKDLGFLIDHEASGLTPPDPSLVLGRHEINSSPSMLDVAPASWGDIAGQLFVAEWGDLAPPTNPLRGTTPTQGYRVAMVDPTTGSVTSFVANVGGGPASASGATGIERPFDVKFGPDDAMYIVDYGIVEIDMTKKPPYDYKSGSGTIWKVSKE